MSAVILQFPSAPRPSSERVRAVKNAVQERAVATNAPLEQRRRAIDVALAEMARGGFASSAIRLGWAELPSVKVTAYRQPTFPGDAA